MRKEYLGASKYYFRKTGLWKVIAIACFGAFIMMSVVAFAQKISNNRYKKVIIKMSEEIPNTKEQEEELEKIRKREAEQKENEAE